MTDIAHAIGALAGNARDFHFTYAQPGYSIFRKSVIRAVELLTGQPLLERMYRDWSRKPQPEETIFAAAIRLMRMDIETDYAAWRAIPASGPVLVVANHPFGVIDGLALGYLATLVRRDVKIMTHSLLCQPPEVQPFMLPIDFGGSANAQRISARSRGNAIRWLKDGHVVVVFPAGGVSTAPSPFARHAVDGPWHPFVGKLMDVPGVSILPVFFAGQNSRIFQIASHVSYTLRLALLFSESVRHLNGGILVKLGKPLSAADFAASDDRNARVRQLRRMTYRLAGAGGPRETDEFVWPRHVSSA